MNGIDKITGQIDADIQKEIDALTEKAKAEAGEIAARFEAEAKKETEALLEQGRRGAGEHEERLVSMARLEAKKQVLAAKQDLVDAAFQSALEQLLKLPEEEYISLLAKLAVNASATGKEQVILSQKDRTRYGKQIVTKANELLGKSAHLTLSGETRSIQGGLILAGERMEVNCSFETLVRLQKEGMTGEVAQTLFGA